MSPRRRDPLEERLDRLGDLREDPDSPATTEALRAALGDRHNLVAAKAARMAAELGKDELASELTAAFDRFLDAEADRGCHAKTAIAKALVELDHPATRLFRRGIRVVQMEGAYGGPVDVAQELRANCAIGLVNSGHPDAVVELVPLLTDPGLPVRLAAAQGIGASGRAEAEAVLRLKALVGDEEPEVITECLAALLRLAPERSLEFVEPFLASGGPFSGARREAAILALGESRLEEAVGVLRREWGRSHDGDSRRTVLLALVTSRRESALDFLLSLVAEGEPRPAREALSALAIHRRDERIRERVAAAVRASKHSAELARHVDREF
jgi:HEAT repeat protein